MFIKVRGEQVLYHSEGLPLQYLTILKTFWRRSKLEQSV